MPEQALREPWKEDFPPVWIHAEESVVKKHADYGAAKAGSVRAAVRLVRETMNVALVGELRRQVPDGAVLVPVHAAEMAGVNVIPVALAKAIAQTLGWSVQLDVIQTNLVAHTGASGFERLANQAVFAGRVEAENRHIIVDDFVGQGGTIANLRGHIMRCGSAVIGATVLTGKAYSGVLKLPDPALVALRSKHGNLENWWRSRFGFGFDCLTASEARYLIRTPDAATVVTRIEQATKA
jgi:hypothetical protein